MTTRIYIALAALAMLPTCLSCQSNSLVTRIQPHEMTNTRLSGTWSRIRRYWNEHRTLPANLADLPEIEGKDCSLEDGWGNPLVFSVENGDLVRIRSLGRDNKPGGVEEDADRELAFDTSSLDELEVPVVRKVD